MTNYKEHFKQLLPVIQAWTEGKTIQFNVDNLGWKDFLDSITLAPGWSNANTEWRVKPEKKVLYVNIDEDEFLSSFESRVKADLYSCEDRTACIRVEYEEGQYDD